VEKGSLLAILLENKLVLASQEPLSKVSVHKLALP